MALQVIIFPHDGCCGCEFSNFKMLRSYVRGTYQVPAGTVRGILDLLWTYIQVGLEDLGPSNHVP